jgi:Flp pilus assembly protein TadG
MMRYGAAVVRRRVHGVARWLHGDDDGAVTAEFATVLPAVMVIALVLMSLARAVVVSMDCQDAAAVVARELVVARGEVDGGALVRSVAGPGATVAVDRAGDTVTVTTSCPVIPGPGNVLPTKVRATAVGRLQ